MRKIAIVRHGEVERNPPDRQTLLSDFGKRQIERIGKALGETRWYFVFSSSYLRCIQSTMILCNETTAIYHIDAGLNEIGEEPTIEETNKRVIGAIDRILSRYTGNIIFVTHGHICRVIHQYLTGVDEGLDRGNFVVVETDK